MSGSVAVRQRSRSGCLTCRRRRRKCDESRPKCKNCTEKQLQCRYGMKIVFRDSNLLGLTASERRELEQRGPNNYSDLRFVDAMEDNLVDFELSSTEDQTSPTTRLEATEGNQLKEPHHALEDNYLRTDNDWDLNEPDPPMMIATTRNHTIRTSITSMTSSHEPPSPRVEESTGRTNSLHQPHDTVPFHYPASPMSLSFSLHSSGSRNQFSSEVRVQQNHYGYISFDSLSEIIITGARKQLLLKTFFEKSSSWLDLNHLTNSLALELAGLARTSPPLLYSMLENAACHDIMSDPSSKSRSVRKSLRALASKYLESEKDEGSTTIAAAAEALLKINELLMTPLSDWHAVLQRLSLNCNTESLQTEVSSQLLLSSANDRFDIAASIISLLPTITDFEQYNLPQPHPTNKTQHSIILCAKILNFCLATTIRPAGKREEWSRLNTMLEDWQLHLAVGVQPLLNINGVKAVGFEDISTSFPVIIYTKRSTFYTAFLFHLSCLMLLQNRPHSLRRMKSTCLRTIVYHAVYFCGISKSNRVAWSWDPIVVAALLYAGKLLSYRGQQTELLEHLKELTELTRWKTSKEIDTLREYWRIGQ